MSWISKLFRKSRRAVDKLKEEAKGFEDDVTKVIPSPIWAIIKSAVEEEAKKKIPGAEKALEAFRVVKSLYPDIVEDSDINFGIEAAVRLSKLTCKIIREEETMNGDKPMSKKPWHQSLTILVIVIALLTIVGSWWCGASPDETLNAVSDMLAKYALPIETIVGLFAAKREGLTL